MGPAVGHKQMTLPVEGGTFGHGETPSEESRLGHFPAGGRASQPLPPGLPSGEWELNLPAAVGRKSGRLHDLHTAQAVPTGQHRFGIPQHPGGKALEFGAVSLVKTGLVVESKPFRRLPPALYGHRRLHRIVNEVSPLQNEVHPKGLAKGPLRRKGTDLQGGHGARFKLNQERPGRPRNRCRGRS